MLILQTQFNNNMPEWVEFTHSGYTFRVTACKRKTVMHKKKTDSVIMMIEADMSVDVQRTGKILNEKDTNE